jgi:hypothetical protein
LIRFKSYPLVSQIVLSCTPQGVRPYMSFLLFIASDYNFSHLVYIIIFSYSYILALTDVIVCEDQSAYIRCRYSSRISISEAIYGRSADRSICPHPSIRITHCRSYTSDRMVKAQCDGQRICRVKADYRLYGDPSWGTYKYLEVKYKWS